MKPLAFLTCLVFVFSGSLESQLHAQRTRPTPNRNKITKEKEKVAGPEVVTLTTKDQVSLVATFYAGPKSKDTPAVVIVHDWGADRKGMEALALYLQKELKASVIVPDLRGHGQSTTTSNGGETTLNYKKFKRAEIMSTLADLEACKKFLMKNNNDGNLNIEMLSIIAVGESAKFAIDWSISDWSWPTTPGGVKQGQDIKFISLVSPFQKIEGLSIKQSLKAPLMSGKGMPPIPMQIMWAHDSNKSLSNAKAIYTILDKSRRKTGKDSLTMSKISGSRNSPTGLLTSRKDQASCFAKIAKEIKKRIMENKDMLVWQNRSSK